MSKMMALSLAKQAKALLRKPLRFGNKVARYASSKARYWIRGQADSPDLHRQPLVSVLLVTYNSADFLQRLLVALSKQTYGHFELICIDNASSDPSCQIVESYQRIHADYPINLIAQDSNTGYAAAVNHAYQHAQGEYLALLNADAEPAENWLLELVNALSRHPSHSAVSPKILFDSPFSCFTLQFDQRVCLDLNRLVQSLPYPKLFVREGELRHPDRILSTKTGSLVLELPAQTKVIHLQLIPEPAIESIISSEASAQLLSVFPGPRLQSAAQAQLSSLTTLEVKLPAFQAPAYWLINNAGSSTSPWADQPYDVGFAVRDSPRFDQPRKHGRRRFCGCSVLIRRSALLDRDLFIPEFFAYYEDSELSRWLLQNRRGPILYWPRAVLTHHHSSTLGEFSPAWSYLTTRSRILYDLVVRPLRQQIATATTSLPQQLETLASHASACGTSETLIASITGLDQCLMTKLRAGQPLTPRRRSIAVFNLFWNTYGGGEAHALHIARRLKDEHPDCHVYLLSETDFDLNELASYFDVKADGLLKLVVKKVTTALTQRFWLFVNSTSHSSLASTARNSWYVVSFPHRCRQSGWMKAYTFLPNSGYTYHWMQKWWGKAQCQRAQILYPVAHLNPERAANDHQVEPLQDPWRILSVGRITQRGHAKNQHLILDAFLRIAAELPQAWQLCLAGSLDQSNSEDLLYYQSLQARIEASGHGNQIRLLANVSRPDLDRLLHHSAFFVHAAGLEQSARHAPELHEHFGIAPVEAALAGCVPVVYAVGGPAEVLQHTGCGHCFTSLEGLVDTLRHLCQLPVELIEQQRSETRQRTQRWLEAASRLPLPQLQSD